jgi:hypothetical protein
MAQLFNGDRLVALDSNGKVIAGALLYFYQTGTTTLQTVYADAGATVTLSNPVVADSGGLFPAIYLGNVNAYKTVLQTSAGATVRTTDPINTAPGTSATLYPAGAPDACERNARDDGDAGIGNLNHLHAVQRQPDPHL